MRFQFVSFSVDRGRFVGISFARPAHACRTQWSSCFLATAFPKRALCFFKKGLFSANHARTPLFDPVSPLPLSGHRSFPMEPALIRLSVFTFLGSCFSVIKDGAHVWFRRSNLLSSRATSGKEGGDLGTVLSQLLFLFFPFTLFPPSAVLRPPHPYTISPSTTY